MYDNIISEVVEMEIEENDFYYEYEELEDDEISPEEEGFLIGFNDM